MCLEDLEENDELVNKGHPPSADLRYGGKDTFSPNTFIFAT